MKNLNQILTEITEITTNIETNYPELYRSLDENPLTIPDTNSPHIDSKIMEEYLESLKQLLSHYLETHTKKNI
jgi:hypothetical protein